MFDIIADAVVGYSKKGLEWREDQTEFISWVLNEEVEVLYLKNGGKERDQESRSASSNGSAHHNRSRHNECTEISDG